MENNQSQILYLKRNLIQEDNQIGIGGYGKVYSGKYKKLEIAIKKSNKLNNSEEITQQLNREINIIKTYRHPYVPRFIGVYSYNNNLELILEKIEGETLEEWIKMIHKNPKNETIVFKTISDLQKQILFCHEENVQEAHESKKLSDKYNYLGKFKSFIKKESDDAFSNFNNDNANISMKNMIKREYEIEREKSIINPQALLDKLNIQLLLQFIDLAKTIKYLHGINLIHRDLKPSNLILDLTGRCRLLDFGISKRATHTLTKADTGGTMNYMAPENFRQYTTEKDTASLHSFVSTKVDIWAFGCILSQTYSGEKPWSNIDSNALMIKLCKVANFGEKFNIPIYVKENHRPIYFIIKKCIENDPQLRISASYLKFYLDWALYYYISTGRRLLGGNLTYDNTKNTIFKFEDNKETNPYRIKIKKYLNLIRIKESLLEYKQKLNFLIKGNLIKKDVYHNNLMRASTKAFTRKINFDSQQYVSNLGNMPANDPFFYENNLCKMKRNGKTVRKEKYQDFNIHTDRGSNQINFLSKGVSFISNKEDNDERFLVKNTARNKDSKFNSIKNNNENNINKGNNIKNNNDKSNAINNKQLSFVINNSLNCTQINKQSNIDNTEKPFNQNKSNGISTNKTKYSNNRKPNENDTLMSSKTHYSDTIKNKSNIEEQSNNMITNINKHSSNTINSDTCLYITNNNINSSKSNKLNSFINNYQRQTSINFEINMDTTFSIQSNKSSFADNNNTNSNISDLLVNGTNCIYTNTNNNINHNNSNSNVNNNKSDDNRSDAKESRFKNGNNKSHKKLKKVRKNKDKRIDNDLVD